MNDQAKAGLQKAEEAKYPHPIAELQWKFSDLVTKF